MKKYFNKLNFVVACAVCLWLTSMFNVFAADNLEVAAIVPDGEEVSFVVADKKDPCPDITSGSTCREIGECAWVHGAYHGGTCVNRAELKCHTFVTQNDCTDPAKEGLGFAIGCVWESGKCKNNPDKCAKYNGERACIINSSIDENHCHWDGQVCGGLIG